MEDVALNQLPYSVDTLYAELKLYRDAMCGALSDAWARRSRPSSDFPGIASSSYARGCSCERRGADTSADRAHATGEAITETMTW